MKYEHLTVHSNLSEIISLKNFELLPTRVVHTGNSLLIRAQN